MSRHPPFPARQMLLATVGFSLLLVVGAAHSDASPDLMAYQFDDSLLMGSPMGKGQLSRFNRPDQIDAGTYSVDLFVNGAFISRQSVEFRAEGEGEPAKAVPCLSDRFLVDSVHVLASKLLSSSVQHNGQRDSDPLSDQPVCLALDQRVPGGLYKLDVAMLRLDL